MPANWTPDWATNWRLVILVVCAAALGLVLFNASKTHERGGKLAQIQTQIEGLKVRQTDLKARFDALLAESEKAPNDPEVLKALGTRHLELVKEDQALKDDVDRLQRDLDAVKR
jgi:apolipoprotein N-acyltransferase